MNDIIGAVDQQLHRLDLVQLAALGLVAAVVAILLLVALLATATRSLKQVKAMRDELDLRTIRQHEALLAILKQSHEGVAEIQRVRQAIGSYATQRDSQIEERKQILKSIAGHLKSVSG